MKKGLYIVLSCSIIFSACSGNGNKENIVNQPDIPVRVYAEDYSVADETGEIIADDTYLAAFDNKVETVWNVSEKRVVTATCSNTCIRTISLYNVKGVKVTIRANGANGTVLGTVDDTTARSEGWIDIAVGHEIETCVFIVEPQESQACIAHIELWGQTDNVAGISAEYRDHIGDIQPMTVHGDVYTAILTETESNQGQVTIANPWQYRRVYVVFTASAFRPVSVGIKVNECDWLGGLVIPESAGNASVTTHSIEINPQWLIAGTNTIYFKGAGAQELSLKEIRVIGIKDTGYNETRGGDRALVDGDVGTYSVLSNGGAIVTAERLMRVYGVLVYGNAGTLLVQCKVDGAWVTGGTVTVKQGGWYYCAFDKAVISDTVRLMNVNETKSEVSEVAMCASPCEAVKPEIVISYPRNGEYFGRTAYIEGFVKPYATQSGVARLTVSGREVPLGVAGGFTAAISKDMVGLSSQDDDTPWELVLQATYRTGTVALQRLFGAAADDTITGSLKLDNGYMPLVTTQTQTPEGGSGGQDVSTVGGNGITVKVFPDKAQTVYHAGAELSIPKGAVDEIVTITIIPLAENEVKPLTPGMSNVTAPAAGYRFLFNGKPHGSFKKAITISIPYDKNKLLTGLSEEQIQMYYYDDAQGLWKRMEQSRVVTKQSSEYTIFSKSVSAPAQGGYVVTQSTHFTDFINATLVVPEHPEALSYNPNSIKDIKAGEPLAGMQLIQPPQPGNTGDAGIRFPVTLPKGRGGMQPQLELRYSQQGGNGPFGMGWSVHVSSIGIDTKWGAARYDGSDIYTLDGSQLVPVDGNGNYRTRIEGGFAKIKRHGDSFSNYWWEVTQKNGVKYIYGQTDNARLSGGGKIAQWYLEWMIDPNGNCVHYTYVKDTGHLPGSQVPFVQVYVDSIYYTGYGMTNGPFKVQFVRDEGNRPDTQVDGKYGFLVYTRYRYKNIKVYYNNGLVWDYALRYNRGAFDKSLLAGITVHGQDGRIFYSHDFEYYDEVGWGGDNNSLNMFGEPIEISNEMILRTILLGEFTIGGIGGSTSSGLQIQGSAGFSPFSWLNALSIGPDGSAAENTTHTQLQLIDIDGDGLADQVYKEGLFSVKYRRNTGNNSFEGERVIPGLSSIGKDESRTISKGVGANVYMVGKKKQWSDTNAYTKEYFTDVNGDGFVDFISGSVVYFNHSYTGTVYFSTTPPADFAVVQEEVNAPVSLVDEGQEEEKKYAFMDMFWGCLKSQKKTMRHKTKLIEKRSQEGIMPLKRSGGIQ